MDGAGPAQPGEGTSPFILGLISGLRPPASGLAPTPIQTLSLPGISVMSENELLRLSPKTLSLALSVCSGTLGELIFPSPGAQKNSSLNNEGGGHFLPQTTLVFRNKREAYGFDHYVSSPRTRISLLITQLEPMNFSSSNYCR